MAKDKKFVEEITPRSEDFAQWYTDVVKKAELMQYSSLKGFMIYKPLGYAIWENIQKNMDAMFKETGVENVYMPLLMPESLLKKEAEHVEGFAPEVAWVTQGGIQPLQERLAIRPTSETLFCDLYSSIALLSAGRRPPVPSSALPSSSGRKVIPRMRLRKRPRPEPFRC